MQRSLFGNTCAANFDGTLRCVVSLNEWFISLENLWRRTSNLIPFSQEHPRFPWTTSDSCHSRICKRITFSEDVRSPRLRSLERSPSTNVENYETWNSMGLKLSEFLVCSVAVTETDWFIYLHFDTVKNISVANEIIQLNLWCHFLPNQSDF